MKLHIRILEKDSVLNKNAAKWIAKLNLKKHPEGGYFRETYRSERTLVIPGYDGSRNLSSAIYYLLAKDQVSVFHDKVRRNLASLRWRRIVTPCHEGREVVEIEPRQCRQWNPTDLDRKRLLDGRVNQFGKLLPCRVHGHTRL